MFLRITPWLLLLFLTSSAQTGHSTTPASPTLQQLTQRSSYIFAGTVLTVERVALKSDSELPTVKITFQVNQAIRGVRAKQILTIKEWAALWESGERYRPGERVLLFLHGTSKLGLTSPVSGSFGRFQLDRNGSVLLSVERIAALRTGIPVKAAPVGKPILINNREFTRAIFRKAGE